MGKVRTIKSFSGPIGSFSSDSEIEFPDEYIEEYVRIGYIELLEPEKEPENTENSGENEGQNDSGNPKNVTNEEEKVIKEPENVENQESLDKKAGKNKGSQK